MVFAAMTIPYFYESAALATALLWSFSSLAWSFSGRRVGAIAVTSIRTVLASGVFVVLHLLIFGTPWPTGIDPEPFWLLVVSGVVGAGFSDLILFRGLVLIGPRLGMLILALSPIFTVLIAYFSPMRETIGLQALAGILMTVGGVYWVVAERPAVRRLPGSPSAPATPQTGWQVTPSQRRWGVILCLLSAVGSAIGFVLTRMAVRAGERMFTDGPPLAPVDSFAAAYIRVISAMVALWVSLPLMRRTRQTLAAFSDGRAMLIIAGGVIVGPVLGIWTSMVAFSGLESGIATALINTAPIMLIPIAMFTYGDRPTWRTLVGTLIAVGGVFLLMVR